MNECQDLIAEYKRLEAERDPLVTIGLLENVRKIDGKDIEVSLKLEELEGKIKAICPRGMDELYLND